MDKTTREMIKGWLAMHEGDVEGLVGWMTRSLRIGGRKACRALVLEAARGV